MRILMQIISFFTLSIIPFVVWGNEVKCPCRLEDGVHNAVQILINANSDISGQLAGLDSRGFNKTTEEIEALKVFYENEKLIQSSCPGQYRQINRKYKIFVRKVHDFSKKPGMVVEMADDQAILSTNIVYEYAFTDEERYQKAIVSAGIDESCRAILQVGGTIDLSGKPDSSLQKKCKEDYRKADEEAYNDFRKNELRDQLNKNSAEYLINKWNLPKNGFKVKMIALKAFASKDYNKYRKYLRSQAKYLSTEEKVKLITLIGDFGKSMYKDRMRDRSAKLKFDEVSNAQQVSDMFDRLFVDFDRESAICRHIAALQSVSASDLGMEGLLVSSASAGSFHTNLLLREEDNSKGEAYLINYGDDLEVKGQEGGILLNQYKMGSKDTSNYYLIGKASSSMEKEDTIAVITAESAKIYTEALGNDIRVIEPMAQTTTSIAGAQAMIDGKPVTIFAGEDGNGDKYVGAAIRLDDKGKHVDQKFGTAVAYHDYASASDVKSIDLHLDYQAKTEVELEGKIGDTKLQARADALGLVILDAQTFLANEGRGEVIGFGLPLVGINLGAEVSAENTKTGLSGKLRAETHLRGGLSDTSSMTPGAFVNLSTISFEGRYKKGNHQAMADAIILLDAFGPKGLARLGYGYKSFATQAEAMGRLRDTDAAIREGSLRRVNLKLSQGLPFDDFGVRISFGASMPLEDGPDLSNTRIMGGLGGEF